MSEQEDVVNQLFNLVIKKEEDNVMEICLSRAKRLSDKIFSLKPSQLNGLSEISLNIQKTGFKNAMEEISNRNTKQWKIDNLMDLIKDDVSIFQNKVETAITDSFEVMKSAFDSSSLSMLPPIETSKTQFKLQLLQIYLNAAVEFARVKQSEGRM